MIDPEVSDGCKKLMECELMDAVKLVLNELKGCFVKLVRNELMGSTETGRFESRITAPWYGSRVAGWRVAAGKTTVLISVFSLLASDASLVSLAWNWNVMVPRLEVAAILRKVVTNLTLVTVVSAVAVLLKQLTLKPKKAPDDSVTSIAPMATMTSMSMVAPMASMVVSMESKEAPMASMASVAPMAMMALFRWPWWPGWFG